MGHFVCSACHDKLPKKACGVCSRTVLNRCHGMELVVGSIVVPCSYALHGCTDVMAYHQKREHEAACPHAPCFCPEQGCGFAVGTTEALLDHFTAAHEWRTTRFEYYVPFYVPVKAGVHVVRLCVALGFYQREDNVSASIKKIQRWRGEKQINGRDEAWLHFLTVLVNSVTVSLLWTVIIELWFCISHPTPGTTELSKMNIASTQTLAYFILFLA